MGGIGPDWTTRSMFCGRPASCAQRRTWTTTGYRTGAPSVNAATCHTIGRITSHSAGARSGSVLQWVISSSILIRDQLLCSRRNQLVVELHRLWIAATAIVQPCLPSGRRYKPLPCTASRERIGVVDMLSREAPSNRQADRALCTARPRRHLSVPKAMQGCADRPVSV